MKNRLVSVLLLTLGTQFISIGISAGPSVASITLLAIGVAMLAFFNVMIWNRLGND